MQSAEQAILKMLPVFRYLRSGDSAWVVSLPINLAYTYDQVDTENSDNDSERNGVDFNISSLGGVSAKLECQLSAFRV